jgi:hypothetical protein
LNPGEQSPSLNRIHSRKDYGTVETRNRNRVGSVCRPVRLRRAGAERQESRKTIRPAIRATYDNPEVFAEGMKYVIVNGKVAIDGRKYTGAMAGRALRKTANGE